MKRSPRGKAGNFSVFSHFTYHVPGFSGLFGLIFWFLVGVLLGNVVTLIFTAVLGPDAAAEYGMLVAYPLMFIPAMMYSSARSRTDSCTRCGFMVDSSNFGGKSGVLPALVAVPATLALAICSDAITAVLPEIPEKLKQMLESLTTGNVWLNLLMVSVFAPFFEEWLCRGTVLRGLLGNNVRPVWAIVVSALFFAIIHMNPWQAVPAFLLGCLFGYVYYRTGSIRLTMLMHCANNTFAVILSNIPSLKDVDNWMDIMPGKGYWILFSACLMLVVLAVMRFRRIPLAGPQGNCDRVPSLFDE